MVMNIDVPDDKEFFRVKRILDDLKESPEYEKNRVILLLDMAQKLFEDVEIKTNEDKVRAYRFSGTKIVTAEMKEGEVIAETLKAIEEHFNTDIAIENLTALVRFWKRSSKEREVYRPLLQEIVELVKDTKVFLQETKQIQELKDQMRNKEKVISDLRNENEDAIKRKVEAEVTAKHWIKANRSFVDGMGILFEHLQWKSNKSERAHPKMNILTDIFINLILEGGDDFIENIAKKINLTSQDILDTYKTYPMFLDINPDQDALRLKNLPGYLKAADLLRNKFSGEEPIKETMDNKDNSSEINKKEVKDEQEVSPTKTYKGKSEAKVQKPKVQKRVIGRTGEK